MRKEELKLGDWIRFDGYIPSSYEGFVQGEFKGVFIRWTGETNKSSVIKIFRHSGKVDTKVMKMSEYFDSKAVVYREIEGSGLKCYVPVQMIRDAWRKVR